MSGRDESGRATPVFLSARPALGKALVVPTVHGQLLDNIARCEAVQQMRGQAYMVALYDRIRSRALSTDFDDVTAQLSPEDPDAIRRRAELVTLCALRSVLTREPLHLRHGCSRTDPAVVAPGTHTDSESHEIHVMEW